MLLDCIIFCFIYAIRSLTFFHTSRLYEYFFSEDQGRFVIEVSKTNFKDVENVLKESSVHFDELGLVIKDNFIFLSDDNISIDELAKHNIDSVSHLLIMRSIHQHSH